MRFYLAVARDPESGSLTTAAGGVDDLFVHALREVYGFDPDA